MGRKSGFVAFVLWCAGLFLLAGLHRFYVGRFWTGLLWFFTLGLCGIGQLIDLFRLGDMVQVANSEAASSSQRPVAGHTVAPVFNVSINAMPVPMGSAATLPDQIEAGTRRLLPRN
ncbi:TM2 domain-containing protein [Methylobacterium sp. A54F]